MRRIIHLAWVLGIVVTACSFDSRGLPACGDGCRLGELSCSQDARAVLSCLAGPDGCPRWTLQTECTEGTECTDEGGMPRCIAHECACTPGDTTCSFDGHSTMVCVQDNTTGECSWQTDEQCPEGTRCLENDSGAVCAPCMECVPDSSICDKDDPSRVMKCVQEGSGCTHWEEEECEVGTYCPSGAGGCVPCEQCTAGESRCSSDRASTQVCTQVMDGCMGWVDATRCDVAALEFCDDVDGPSCRVTGDTCEDAQIVPVGTILHFPNFSSAYGDDITRDTANMYTDTMSYPIRWQMWDVSYGPDAFFALRLSEGQAVRIVSSDDTAFLWATTAGCEEKPITFGWHDLVFGAPWDGTFVIGVEADQEATALDVEIIPYHTVCDLYASYHLTDRYAPSLAVDPPGATVCVPVRKYDSQPCLKVKIPSRHVLFAWLTSPDGMRVPGLLGLSMPEATIYPAASQAIDTPTVSLPTLDITARFMYVNEDNDTVERTVCITNPGGAMPYAALHLLITPMGEQRPTPGDVIFSEFYLSDPENGRIWIELKNTTSHPVYLGGCSIHMENDAGSIQKALILNEHISQYIQPHGFYMIVPDDGGLTETPFAFADYHDSMDVLPSLATDSITTFSLVCSGTIIDSLTLDPSQLYGHPWASVQRDPLSSPGQQRWCVSKVPYPAVNWWDSHTYAFGTPRSENVPCSGTEMDVVAAWDFSSSCPDGWGIWQMWRDEEGELVGNATDVMCVPGGAQIDALSPYLYRELAKGDIDMSEASRPIIAVQYEYTAEEGGALFKIGSYTHYDYHVYHSIGVEDPVSDATEVWIRLYEWGGQKWAVLYPFLESTEGRTADSHVLVRTITVYGW